MATTKKPVEKTTKKSAVRYLVSSANPEYAGKTFGIQFNEGKAIIDEATLPQHLKRGVEEIAAGFKAMEGYEIVKME